MAMIKTLYHGTIFDFDIIDLAKCKGYKDFGPGFYTSEVKSHALGMARRNKNEEIQRLKNIGLHYKGVKAYLYEYAFDTDILSLDCNKVFNFADIEWVTFVLQNRSIKFKTHNYDIVKGLTADDGTMITFNAFRNGVYGDVTSQKALEKLLEFLEPNNLPMQTYFGTENAINTLVPKGRIVVQ